MPPLDQDMLKSDPMSLVHTSEVDEMPTRKPSCWRRCCTAWLIATKPMRELIDRGARPRSVMRKSRMNGDSLGCISRGLCDAFMPRYGVVMRLRTIWDLRDVRMGGENLVLRVGIPVI